MKLIVVLMFMTLACSSKKDSKSLTVQTNKIFSSNMHSDTVRFASLEDTKLTSISEIARKYLIDDSTQVSHIENQFKVNEFVLQSIIIEREIVNAVRNKYTLLSNNDSSKFCLLPIEDCFLISESCCLIGGYYLNRDTEYFLVYKINQAYASLVFDSRKIGNYGLKVGYYRGDECFEYKPNRLNFSIIENTLRFQGVLLQFCELNADRVSNTPLDSVELKFLIQKDGNCNLTFDSVNSKATLW